MKKNNFVKFFILMALSSLLASCSDSDVKPNDSDHTQSTTPTQPIVPPPIVVADKKLTPKKYDPRDDARTSFMTGDEISDKDRHWLNGQVELGDGAYALNVYMAHTFFYLPEDEQNRLQDVYMNQWKYSLKESDIKVTYKTELVLNLYDGTDNRVVEHVTNDR